MNDLLIYLQTGVDIPFEDVKIHQPTLFEIVTQYGMQRYTYIMSVLSLTAEWFQGKTTDKLLSKYIIPNQQCLSQLLASLKIFFGYDDVLLYSNRIQLKFNSSSDKQSSFIIDDGNYHNLTDIALKINSQDYVKVEKIPEMILKLKNPIQRERWLKSWRDIQEGRRKHDESNALRLWDAINLCQFCGTYISIKDILTWTIWQIMNAYNAKVDMQGFHDNLSIALVSGDASTIAGDKHWSKKLMLK